jgi:hypothetical protein
MDVSIWVLTFFFKNDLLASPKIIGMHTSTLEYASTASISATPHLHNHGLAMLACITPSRNIRPLPVY